MIILFFLLLRTITAIEIFVSSLRREYCSDKSNLCAGSWISPFGSLYDSLKFVEAINEKASNIDLILMIEEEHNPKYLLLDSEIKEDHYFSPFANIEGKVKVEGRLTNNLNLNEKAVISLRTEKLTFEIQNSLVIINLEFEGTNLATINAEEPCLNSDEGCCKKESLFYNPLSSCMIYQMKFKGMNEEYFSHFSLFRAKSISALVNFQIELNNVNFVYINPLWRWETLIFLETGVNLKANIIFKNVSLYRCDFVAGIIYASGTSDSLAVEGDITLEVVTTALVDYKLFNIESNNKAFRDSLIIFNEANQIRISNSFFYNFFCEKIIFTFLSTTGISFSNMSLNNYSGMFLEAVGGDSIHLNDLKVKSNFPNQNEEKVSIFLFSNVELLEIIDSAFEDLKYFLPGLFTVSNISRVSITNLFLNGIELKLFYLFSLGKIGFLKFERLVINNFTTDLGRLFHINGFMRSFTIYNSEFMYITGRSGIILGKSGNDLLSYFELNNSKLSNIMSKGDSVFHFPIFLSGGSVLIENVQFINIQSGGFLIFCDKETLDDPYYNLTFLTSSVRFSSLTCFGLRSSNISALIFDSIFDNIRYTQVTLMKDISSGNVKIINITLTNSIASESMITIGVLQKLITFTITGSKFHDNFNGALNLLLDSRLIISNSSFKRLDTIQGTNLIKTSSWAKVHFDHCKFESTQIIIFTAILINGNSEFEFTSCLFSDLSVKMVGSVMMISGNSSLIMSDSFFKNITGSSPFLISCVTNNKVTINRMIVIGFHSNQKGGLFMIFLMNDIRVNNSKFIDVTGFYNAPGFWVDLQGNVKITNSVFLKFLGNKGGVFLLKSDSRVTITRSLFINCVSRLEGGVIVTYGFLELVIGDSHFENAFSDSSGGVFYFFQYFKKFDCLFTVLNSNFTNVKALERGGVLYANKIRSITVLNCKFNLSVSQNVGIFFIKDIENINISGSLFSGSYSFEDAGSFEIENAIFCKVEDTIFTGLVAEKLGSIMILSEGNFIISRCDFRNSFNSRMNHFIVTSKVYTKCSIAFSKFSGNRGNSDLFYFYKYMNSSSNVIEITFEDVEFSENSLRNLIYSAADTLIITSFTTKFNMLTESILQAFGGRVVLSFSKSLRNSLLLPYFQLSMIEQFNINSFESEEYSISDAYFAIFGSSVLDCKGISIIAPRAGVSPAIQLFYLRNNNKIVLRQLNITGHVEERANIEFFDCSGSDLEIYNSDFRYLNTFELPFVKGTFIDKNIIMENITFNNCDIDGFFITLRKQSVLKLNFVQITKDDTGRTEKEFLIKIQGDSVESKIELLNSLNIRKRAAFIFDRMAYVFIKNFTVIGVPNSITSPLYFLYSKSVNITYSFFATLKSAGGVTAKFREENPNNEIRTVHVMHCNFTSVENSQAGGGISIYGIANIYLNKVVFLFCSTLAKGGAIYLRSESSENGTFEITDVIFESNSAAWSGAAISFITNNLALISKLKELLEGSRSDVHFQNNSITNFKNKSLPISTFSAFYNFKLSTDSGESNQIAFNSTVDEDFKTAAAPVKFTFYSGENINIEVSFFDHFGSPIEDLDELRFSCEAGMFAHLHYYYMYKNNSQNVKLNGVKLTDLKIISLNYDENNVLDCYLITKGNQMEGPSSDLLFKALHILPINFTQISCTVGQIIRENQCKFCENGYSFKQKPSVNDYCRPCPDNARCQQGSFILPKAGFWNLNSSSLKIFRCDPKEACKMKNFNMSSNCNDGFQGILCKDCSPGFGKIANRMCIACSEERAKAAIVREIIWCLIVIFIILIETSIMIPDGKKKMKMMLFGIKNLILFIETFAISFAVSKTSEPELGILYEIVTTFSFFKSNYFGLECVINQTLNYNFFQIASIILTFLIPFLFSIAVSLLTFALNKLKVSYFYSKAHFFKNNHFLRVPLMISLRNFLPNLAHQFARIFFCFETFYKSDDYRLIAFPNIKCNDEVYWYFNLPINIALLAVYIFVLLIIIKKSRKIKTAINSKRSLNFFQDSFEVVNFNSSLMELTLIFTETLLAVLIVAEAINKVAENSIKFWLLTPFFLVTTYGLDKSPASMLLFFNFFVLTLLNLLNFGTKDSSTIAIIISGVAISILVNVIFILATALGMIKAPKHKIAISSPLKNKKLRRSL